MGYSEIEAIALRDVYLDNAKLPGVSPDFHLRRILREYSQKFHTPLHVVYELPLEFVFQAWLEEYYESKKQEDLHREVIAMLKDPEVLAAERRAEDAEDAETHLFIEEERKIQADMKRMEQVVQSFKKELSQFMPGKGGQESQITMTPTKEKPIEEQITMKFEDVDFEADSFGPFEPPPKPDPTK